VHLDGIRERLLATGPAHGGLALDGEVDLSNETMLVSILQAAMARARSIFCLDLSRPQFLSMAACRALAEGTRRFRDRGGRVLLIAPPDGVAQALRPAGLDRLPNIEIAGNQPLGTAQPYAPLLHLGRAAASRLSGGPAEDDPACDLAIALRPATPTEQRAHRDVAGGCQWPTENHWSVRQPSFASSRFGSAWVKYAPLAT
jgi:anti-anti-sigma factor